MTWLTSGNFCQQLWVLSSVVFVVGAILAAFLCQWQFSESAKKKRKGRTEYDARSHDSYY